MKDRVITNPRITEKASNLIEGSNAYTFDVSRSASKQEISKAIFEIYKVKPVRINVLTIPTKKLFSSRTGLRGSKGGGRKAVVFLKEGEKIEFI